MTSEDLRGAPAAASAGRRWMVGLATGVALAIPFGYLFSYLAFLPAMLGLFFFLLFGLLIGAAMFRVWAPLRPIPPGRIGAGIAAVSLIGWMGSLVWEGQTFPHQAAKEAIRQVPKEVPGKTPDDIRAEAVDATKEFLRRNFPPGGVVGYWRWALKAKNLEIPIVSVPKPKPIRLGNTRWLFVVRVILSAVALTAGIHAMVKPLSKPAPPPDVVEAAPVLH